MELVPKRVICLLLSLSQVELRCNLEWDYHLKTFGHLPSVKLAHVIASASM